MENKLFLIGIKCSLDQLAEKVGLVDTLSEERHIAYFEFWENICFIEYNQDTHKYSVKEVVDGEVKYYYCEKENDLFRHMDDNGIRFIGDENPMGAIFSSYAAAYLEVIRWSAEIAYSKKFQQQLLEE